MNEPRVATGRQGLVRGAVTGVVLMAVILPLLTTWWDSYPYPGFGAEILFGAIFGWMLETIHLPSLWVVASIGMGLFAGRYMMFPRYREWQAKHPVPSAIDGPPPGHPEQLD